MAIIPGGDGRAERRASAKPAASQPVQGTQLDGPPPRLVVLRSAATHQLCGARGALLADALGQAGAAGKRAVRVSVRVRVMARYHRASGCHRRGSILVRRVSRVVEVVGVVEASREWSHSTCRRHTLTPSYLIWQAGRLIADTPWATWTGVLGFPVLGVWPDGSDGSDINAAHRSNDGQLVLTADDFGGLKLFHAPCAACPNPNPNPKT